MEAMEANKKLCFSNKATKPINETNMSRNLKCIFFYNWFEIYLW